MKIPKLELEIEGCNTSRKELNKLIPELKTKVELNPTDKAKLKELQKSVEKCKSDMVSCQEIASKLESEVAELQQAILDAGGSKLKKQQAACDKVLKELNDAEKALNTAKVMVTSSQKAAAKAKKQKEGAEKQLEECEKLLEEKQKEFKELEEKAVEVLQAYESVKKVEAAKREELETATKECEDLKKSHAEARCIEIDLLGQIEAFDRQISDSTKNKKQWEKKLVDLRSAEEEDDDDDLSDGEEEQDEQQSSGERGTEEANEDVAMDDVEEDTSIETEDRPKEKVQRSNSSLPTLPFTALEKYSIDDVKVDIDHLESERNTLAKNANMGAIQEYKKKEADYLARYVIEMYLLCISPFF